MWRLDTVHGAGHGVAHQRLLSFTVREHCGQVGVVGHMEEHPAESVFDLVLGHSDRAMLQV